MSRVKYLTEKACHTTIALVASRDCCQRFNLCDSCHSCLNNFLNIGSFSRDFRRHTAFIISRLLVAAILLFATTGFALADRLRMIDGTIVEVDEAWEDAQGVWFRRNGVTQFVERTRVKKIERATSVAETSTAKADAVSKLTPVAQSMSTSVPVRIYLVGGARIEVDEAAETADGVWHRRGNVSMLLERSRVERIERGPLPVVGDSSSERAWKAHGWTTGRAGLDALIRQSGARYGVDPYLIFCVMEQESHFNAGALSPKGARGLMQLMPGTAARFGVRNSRDPAQNIMGGTRYLKELHQRFGGRVDLVLASYNAGEGAVMKYGQRVPPYRETRNYVRRISSRYQRGALPPASPQTNKADGKLP